MSCASSVISALLFLTATAGASTFYVDPSTGSNSNDGSSAHPWKTIQEVIDSGKIATREPVSYPYTWGQPLQTRNASAPVKAGDTLLLRTGYHGTLTILRAYNTSNILIAAASGQTPRVKAISVTAATNWTIRGLSVSPEHASVHSNATLCNIANHNYSGPSADITIDGCSLFSASNTAAWDSTAWNTWSANGISVSANRVRVTNNHIWNVNFALAISGDSCFAGRNLIENFSGDGMRGLGDDDTFDHNIVRNCYDVNDNHYDGFQSWSLGATGVGTGTVFRMRLVGNTFINSTDPSRPFQATLQGIGCFDGMFEDWTVENNVVITDHWHGITLLGAKNCRIINNTVVDQNNVSPGPPWIQIGSHKNGTLSTGNVVRNNLVTDLNITNASSNTVDHNIEIARYSDYGTYFLDYPNYDLRLVAGCAAVDSGSSTGAPAVDFLGTPRPRGSRVDVGAYEYSAASVIPRSQSHTPDLAVTLRNGRLAISGLPVNTRVDVRVTDMAGRTVLARSTRAVEGTCELPIAQGTGLEGVCVVSLGAGNQHVSRSVEFVR